jgi:hypothetical protein
MTAQKPIVNRTNSDKLNYNPIFRTLLFNTIIFILFSGCINNIKVDIVFSLDESESVNTGVYGELSDTVNALSDTVGRLNIDVNNGVQVEVMALHNITSARKVFGLSDYTSVSAIQSALSSVEYGGLPNTDMSVGLNFGCFEMFGGPDDRHDAPNYLIYLTHGETNTTLVTEAANNCTVVGVNVGVVAIETTSDTTILSAAASSPSHFLDTYFFCLAGNLARLTYNVTNCQWCK